MGNINNRKKIEKRPKIEKENKIRKKTHKSSLTQKAFVLILIYMTYVIIISMFRTKVSFYEVISGSIVEDNSHKGLILRDEVVSKSTLAGNINYFVREARHVAVGQEICAIDGTGALNKFIKENKLDNFKLSDNEVKKIKNNLSLFTTSYNDQNFNLVYDQKYLLNSALLESENTAFLEGLEEKLNQENIQYTRFKAENLGFVSYIIDEMEDLKPQDISKEYFEKRKKNFTRQTPEEKVDINVPIYKIITEQNWSVIFPLNKEEQELYKDKKSLNIKFPSKNLSLKANYSSFVGKDALNYGKLDFDKYIINFISDRYIDFEIENKKAIGLKIPLKSVLEKEFFVIPEEFAVKGGNSKEIGFNKEIYIDNKASIQFVNVDIYAFVDGNYYISTHQNSALLEGDLIVKNNTNEKYKISQKAKLKGVYNINKGYVAFKYIDILASNEEYCIVANSSKYGLNIYDHILTNPSGFEDKDFIYQ